MSTVALLLLESMAWAQPPPVVISLDCAGLAESRHSLIITGLNGQEVASSVVARLPEGRGQVVLNPSGIPAAAALVGAHCSLQASIDDGDLLQPFELHLSDRPLEPVSEAPSEIDTALALTMPERRTPALLGALASQALSSPPGNPAEELLARVPRLEGHPLVPLIQVATADGPATFLVGSACACPDLTEGARANATRIGDVVIISAHDGPEHVVLLPEPVDTIAQVLCGCAPASPLWTDQDRARVERGTARRYR